MALPKLNKLLLKGLADLSITDLKPVQEKLFSRFNGGSSIYFLGEENLGKTTGMMIATLQRLNYSQPDTPRVIVMTSKSEDATEIYNRFKEMAKHMDLQIHLVVEEGSMDEQNMAIYAGADLIIGTPLRLTKLYFQCGINVNKVNTLVLYKANKLVENRQLVELDRFTDSLPKFQGIVMEINEIQPKLKTALAKRIPFAQELVAIEEEEE